MQGRRIAALLVLLSFAAFSLAAEDALTTASLGATAAGDGTSVTGSSVTHIEDPTSEAAKSTEPIKSGNDLAEAVEANSEAQDYNEASKPVKAQVIKEEPAAMIASGTGDLDTTGIEIGWVLDIQCSACPVKYIFPLMPKFTLVMRMVTYKALAVVFPPCAV